MADSDTVTLPIGPAPAEGADDDRPTFLMRRPTEGQMYVLMRIEDIIDDDPARGLQTFGAVLEALFVEPLDVRYVHRMLTTGEMDPESLCKLGIDVLDHFFPGNREQKRARASRARVRPQAVNGGRRGKPAAR